MSARNFVKYFVSGGILQWRQNTEKIGIRGGIPSLRNTVKIQLFQVAYFGGEEPQKKWPFGVANIPPKITEIRHFPWAYFRGKNTKICVIH
jgi:hypothetical protein